MVKNGTTAAVGRGSRGRGARSTRRSTGSDSSSPAPRGRPRRSQPVEEPPGASSSPPEAPESPPTDAGRRVSRRQRTPNKRLMPITNGRAGPVPMPATAPVPMPATAPVPTPVSTAATRAAARGGRRTRSAPAAGRVGPGRVGRGRRRAEPEPQPQPEPEPEPPPPTVSNPSSVAELNGVLPTGAKTALPMSFCTVRLTRTELPLPSAASDSESQATSESLSVDPVSEENSLMSEGMSLGVSASDAAPDRPQSPDPVADRTTDSRDSSPDSLVRFRDPNAPERSLGDSMDLDSTLEENDASRDSVPDHQTDTVAAAGDETAPQGPPTPPRKSPDVLEERQELMDCEPSPNQAVERRDQDMGAADSRAHDSETDECSSPIIGATNDTSPRVDSAQCPTDPPWSPIVDVMNSSSSVVEVVDSRSPIVNVLDSQSPVVDVVNSRSPVADATESRDPAVDVVNSRSPENDARDTQNFTSEPASSRSPIVNVVDSRSPIAEVLDSSSPTVNVLDSQSPVVDVLDSRSPLPDVSEPPKAVPSPVPPPDADDNACSLPSMASKASDSEDGRLMASLPTGPEPMDASAEPAVVTDTTPRSSSPVDVVSTADVAADVVRVPSPPAETTSLSSPSPVEETPMPSPPMDIGRAPSPMAEVTPMPSPPVDMEPASPPTPLAITPMPSPPADIGRRSSPPPEEKASSPLADTQLKTPLRGHDEPTESSDDVRSPTSVTVNIASSSPPAAISSPLPPSSDLDHPATSVRSSVDADHPPSSLSLSGDADIPPPEVPAHAEILASTALDPASPAADSEVTCSPRPQAGSPSELQPTDTGPVRSPSPPPPPPSDDRPPSPPAPADDTKSPPAPADVPSASRAAMDVQPPSPSAASPVAADHPPSADDEPPASSPMSDDSACSPPIAYSDDDGDLSELWPLPPSLGRPVAPPSIEGDSASVDSDVERPPSPSLDDAEGPSSPLPESGDRLSSPTPLDEQLKSLDVGDSPAERGAGSPRRGPSGEIGLSQGDVEMRRVSREEAERAAAVCDIPLPPPPASPVDMDISTPDTSADGAAVEGCESAPVVPVAGVGTVQPSPPPAGRHCSVESGDRASPFMGMFDEDDSPFVVRPADEAPPGSSPHRHVSSSDEPAGPPRPLVSYSARRQRPGPVTGAAGDALRTVVVSSAAAVLLPFRGLAGSLPMVAQSQLAAASRAAVVTSSRPVVMRPGALLSGDEPPGRTAKTPQNRATKAPKPSKASKANKANSQDKSVGRSGKSPSGRSKSGSAAALLDSLADPASGLPAGKGSKTAVTPTSDKATGSPAQPTTGRATKPKTKFLERLSSSGSPSSPKRCPTGGKSAASPQTERRGQAVDVGGQAAAALLPLDIPLPPTEGSVGAPDPAAAARQQTGKSEAKSALKSEATTLDKKFKDSRVEAIKDKDINKLRKFKTISDSIWLKKQKLTKQQKEARHMVCDCYLSPEEMERGDMGCGEDCLNRLLMIECGSRCPLGDRCSNKRFTKKETHPTSVFKTELKGYGLRADVEMPENAFIYEYVGEVLDAAEFRRRTKEYDRLKYHHYYFMALKGDAIIDATEKGNASRFINHSCDPNSETQKWTVNGELRIGFFTRRSVSAGEEITFDYQLQRYGKEAQKCFCASEICRGWIGEKTDDTSDGEDDEESEPEEMVSAEAAPRPAEGAATAAAATAEVSATQPAAADGQPGPPTAEPRPPKVTKQAKQRRDAEKRDLEIEINKLAASGLKSKQHTLELSRLMVRAESEAERLTLLELIRTADHPCRRLFLDYHGLRLLWSWMASAPAPQGVNDDEVYRFRRKVLETLSTLPIPNKTCLTDSRVLSAVERWASAGQPATPCTPDQEGTPSDTAPGPDTPSAAVGPAVDSPAATEVTELAARLLQSWAGLQEVFRIPKKERVEIMREHEKEADRGYQTYLQQHPRPSLMAAKKGYDWSPERRKRAWDSPEPEPRVKKYRPMVDSRLTKEERRQLFMMEVQREEEARQQRQQQQQLWRGHEQRCTMLGLDPHLTPIFDPSYQYYWEPSAGAWQPYTPGDPAVPLVPAPGVDPLHVAALPQQLAVYQGMAAVDPAQAEQYLEQLAQQRTAQVAAVPLLPPGPAGPQTDENGLPLTRPGLLELIQSQLPGRFMSEDGCEIALASVPDPDSNAAYQLACYNDPSLPNVSVGNIPLPERAAPGQPPPPPPPPPEPVITLPPRWRIAKDDNDRVYFYHQVTRQTQWTPPVSVDWIPRPGVATVQQTLWTAGGSSSADSSPTDGSSSSSSSDSSSSSEDESKPGEEDDEPVASELPEEMAKEEDIDRRRMVNQHRRRRGKRRDRLVQERVISPVPEMSRHELRRERHRLKREAKAEARRERRLDPDSAPRGPRPRRRRPVLLPPAEPPEPADDGEPPDTEQPAVQEPYPAGQEQQEPAEETEQEPDQSRKAKEERIRKFKAKEEALRKYQAKKQEARARRKRKAAVAAAAAAAAAASSSSSKKRKVEVKRVSSSATSAGSSSSSAATTSSSSSSSSSSRKEKPTTAAADTSSEVAKKIKDKFLSQMSGVIVSALNAFRKSGCKQGRITSNEDFKFLAKKLTHHVMVKELKNVQQVEELSASESVKHKAKYYVKKYMGRFGETYSKESLLTDEPEAAESAH